MYAYVYVYEYVCICVYIFSFCIRLCICILVLIHRSGSVTYDEEGIDVIRAERAIGTVKDDATTVWREGRRYLFAGYE